MDNKNLYTYSVENNKVTITKRNVPVIGEFTIPSEIDGCPVVRIIDRSFFTFKQMTKLTVPAGVTELVSLIHRALPLLEEIVVSENNPVFSSEDGVLFDKDKTKLLKYPSAKPGTVYRIPDSVKSFDPLCAFERHCHLTDFEVGENSETYSVRDGVLFSKDGTVLIKYPAGKKQTSYRVPDGVKRIKDSAFFGVKNLTEVTLPASTMCEDDFSCCSRLTEIHVDADNPYHESVNGILFDKKREKLLFCLENSPLADYVVPESVKEVATFAFTNCHNLKSLAIPGGITLDEIMFAGCTSLEKFIIGSGEPIIDIMSVCDCDSLKSIALPAGRVDICVDLLEDCPALEEIRFGGTKQQWEDGAFYDTDMLKKVKVYFDCDLDSMIASMKN